MKLPDVVYFKHRSGREIRKFFVIRRFECERSDAGDECAAARNGAAVEIDAQHEQAPKMESRRCNPREVAALILRTCQRAAELTFPATRLNSQKLVDPAPDVVSRLQYDVL